MHISTHNVDDLNAKVVINLAPSDYTTLVENKLREHAKKVKMPGFRPGKVPAGMVKKMYGTSILIDQVNDILSRKVYEYIREENLNILGSPLPSETSKPKADWENPKEMEFTYDLGLAPSINLNSAFNASFTFYVIRPTEKDIESSLENIAKRSGEMTEVESVGETDLVKVQWVELKEDGTPKEGGVLHSSSISMDNVKDAEAKQQLLGLKVGESQVLNHNHFSENDTDHAAMLGVQKEDLGNLNPNFKITVERIQRLTPAEINEDLFKRMYPDGSVTSLDELKAKITEDYSNYFAKESDRKLKNDIVLHLLSEVNISLPDAFLKRWLVISNENKVTAEDIEREYDNYAKGLKWQLIENNIIKEQSILVNHEELREGIRAQLLQQFAAYGIHQADAEMMNGMVDNFMKREDEVRKVNEQLYDQKVIAYCKTKFKLNETTVNSEEFYSALSQENI